MLGGGDTSADCLGCALREGARSVTEIAHGPMPPHARDAACDLAASGRSLLRTHAAHEEGGRSEWEFEPTALVGDAGAVGRARPPGRLTPPTTGPAPGPRPERPA